MQQNPTLDAWVYECILGKCHIVECSELGGYELRWWQWVCVHCLYDVSCNNGVTYC